MTETELQKIVTGAIDRAFSAVEAKRAKTAGPRGAIADTAAHADQLRKAYQATGNCGAGLEAAEQRSQAVASMRNLPRVRLHQHDNMRKSHGPSAEEWASADTTAQVEQLRGRQVRELVKRAPRLRIGA